MKLDYPADRIEFLIAGELDTPVLFLHGWGGDANSLKQLSQPISEHRQTVSISLPGFGNSPEPNDQSGTWDYVEFVHGWLITNGFNNVAVIGHSFGGRVAIGLAYRYPKSVNRLVLISSAGLALPRNPKVKTKLILGKSINRIGNFIGGEFNRKLQIRKQKMGSADWQAASPVMRRILGRVINEDFTAEIRKIKAKTLLLWGSNDSDVPVKLAKRMNELISDSNLTIISGAGHYPFLDEPGKTLSVVWDWLELPQVW